MSLSKKLSKLNCLSKICIESIALALASKDTRIDLHSLSILSPNICQMIQSTLIEKNWINDHTLLNSTSSLQSHLSIPFSIPDSDSPLSSSSIHASIKKCSKTLQSLECRGHELEASTFSLISSPSLTPSLNHISLIGCNIPSKCAREIVTSRRGLETLNLSGNGAVDDYSFCDSILDHSGINSMEVDELDSHNFKKRKHIESDFMTEIKGIKKTFKSQENGLSLHPSFQSPSSSPFSVNIKTISTPSSLLSFQQRWNLLELKLSGCSKISDSTLNWIGTNLPHLTALDVSHCELLTDMTSVLLGCQDLEHLTLDGNFNMKANSSKLLEQNVDNSPYLSQLKSFHWGGSGTMEESFATWFEHSNLLQEFHIPGKTIPQEADEFGNEFEDSVDSMGYSTVYMPMLVRILAKSSNLNSLDLHGVNVSYRTLDMILKRQTSLIQTMKYLDLVNCPHMCLVSIHKLLTKLCINSDSNEVPFWNSLHNLKIGMGKIGYISFSDQLLFEIGQKAPNLKTLVFKTKGSTTPLLRPVQLAKALQSFNNLRSLEIWSLSSVSPLLTRTIGKLCPKVKSVSLCVVTAPPQIDHQVAGAIQHDHHRNLRNHQRQLQEPSNVRDLHSALAHPPSSSNCQASFLSPQAVEDLQSQFPSIEWKLWKHGVESTRHFQHIQPKHLLHSSSNNYVVMNCTHSNLHDESDEEQHVIVSLKPLQVTNVLSVSVSPEYSFSSITQEGTSSSNNTTLNDEADMEEDEDQDPETSNSSFGSNSSPSIESSTTISSSSYSHISSPTLSPQLSIPPNLNVVIKVDGIPVFSGEKNASMRHLTASIWSLITNNAGAVPMIEEWCCDCNIEAFNGVLFYDDTEFVYWDVYEPGPSQSFKFHKSQYVAAIASAMQQQWKCLLSFRSKDDLIQEALNHTQQHAWNQKLLDPLIKKKHHLKHSTVSKSKQSSRAGTPSVFIQSASTNPDDCSSNTSLQQPITHSY